MKLTAFLGLDLKRLFRGGFPGVPPVGVYALLFLILAGDAMVDAIMYNSEKIYTCVVQTLNPSKNPKQNGFISIGS